MDVNNKEQILTTNQLIQSALARYLEITNYLLRLDKKDFILNVTLNFFVKAISFVATLLPIKIVLLLSPNQEVPNMLHGWFSSKANLVYILCVMAIILLLISNAFASIAEVIISKKTRIIVEKNGPMKKYRKNRIKQIVRKCILGLSDLLLSICFLVAIGIIYLDLSLVIVACLLSAYVFLYAMENTSIYTRFRSHPNILFARIKEVIFFVAFFYIVADTILIGGDHNFIVLIISLIMLRQCVAFCSQFCCHMVVIHKNRNVLIN